MGSACCVAARDRTISSESHCEVLQRNARYSPSWSFRWDNRGRVAGEDASVNWFSDGRNVNNGLGIKSGATVDIANASDEGNSLESVQTLTFQRSPMAERNSGILINPPDHPVSKNPTKAELESSAICDQLATKSSSSAHSNSSLSTSSLSPQGKIHLANLTPSRWPCRSPGSQLSRQGSDNHIQELKSSKFPVSEDASSFVLPGWSNASTRGSNVGSSDSWSITPFSEIMTSSYPERWSSDNESLAFSHDKTTISSGRISASASSNIHTCGVCSKLLTERSSWGSHKIIATNELAVVAVLICGHVYHAECLENMTPEINKYDPPCPVCTLGEKQVLKLSERALKADMEWKTKNKRRSRNRIVGGDHNHDFVFGRQKSCGHVDRGLDMISSPSIKSSLKKPFLRRHFSFGSKGSKAFSENQNTQKKGFFWSKSTKE